MFFNDIIYLLLLIGLPFLCSFFNEKIKIKKSEPECNKIIKVNNILFYLLTSFALTCSIFSFNTHIVEPLMAALYVDMCVKIMGTKIYNIYHNIKDGKLIMKIICLLLIPSIFMMTMRNFFDTYVIGMWLFNISDFILLLYEIICVVLINLANIFITKYGNAYYFVTYISIVFIATFLIL
jgi:hypothetical protein